jgi:hypothetical protein
VWSGSSAVHEPTAFAPVEAFKQKPQVIPIHINT